MNKMLKNVLREIRDELIDDINKNIEIEYDFDKINPILICSLIEQEQIFKLIDKMYSEKEDIYYDYYILNKDKYERYQRMYLLKSEKYFIKLIGILEYYMDTNDIAVLNKLFNKGFKTAYDYFKQRMKEPLIDYDEFKEYLIKTYRSRNIIDTTSHLHFAGTEIVLVHLCNHYNKIFLYKESNGAILNNLIQFEALVDDIGNYQCSIDMDTIEKLQKVLNFPLDIFKSNKKYKASRLVEYMLQKTVAPKFDKYIKLLEAKGKNPSNITPEDLIDINFDLSDNVDSFIKIHSLYGDLIVKLGLYSDNLLEYFIIGKKEMSIILDTINYSFKRDILTCNEENIINLFISTLFIYSLIYNYKKDKEEFIDEETIAFKNSLKDKEDLLNTQLKTINSYKEDNKKLLNEKEDLIKEIKDLNKKISKFENKLDNIQENKKELEALRSMSYCDDELIEESKLEDEKQLLKEFLADKSVVLIGGHQSLQQKLTEIKLDINIISVDSSRYDENILDKMDIVLIYYKYMNHAMYYRVMNKLEKNKSKLVFIKNSNINIIRKQLMEN